MTATTISRADRDRMANELDVLGLYLTASLVRSGREKLRDGVAHVRDYCLPNAERAVEQRRKRDKDSPPVPGSWGAHALEDCEARADALATFLSVWDSAATPKPLQGGSDE